MKIILILFFYRFGSDDSSTQPRRDSNNEELNASSPKTRLGSEDDSNDSAFTDNGES